jgi:pyruvate-ferredoxin/flavodoxin oxidoreductase
MRLASDKLGAFAQEMLLKSGLDGTLVEAITKADVSTQEGIEAKRALVVKAKAALAAKGTPEAKRLIEVVDFVVPRSVWIFGGDGWAYDIGFGGLDHVLASGNKVNILCVDTGVYSNTGGQASKSTPRGAAAKFAFTGKEGPRKDLGAMMMSYGTIYVAQIAMGASMPQTIKAIQEAESYPGSSLIIAYAHCIAHGITMTTRANPWPAIQKQAVETGFWPLFSAAIAP